MRAVSKIGKISLRRFQCGRWMSSSVPLGSPSPPAGSAPHTTPVPAQPCGDDDDDWNNWEFGSFLTKTRKTSEQVYADRSAKRMQGSAKASRNIDNEWSFLSDEEVEVGIQALKDASTEGRILKLESVLEKRTCRVRLVFEDPHNPNNLWAALRTADSFGIQNVDIIVNEGHSPAVMQKSMVQALGSQKWLTLTQHSSTNSCLQELESQGYRVIASDLSATSKPVGEIPWSQGCTESSNTVDNYCKNLAPANEDENVKVAIVMGSEKTGISSTMRMQANELFYLPMKGFAESFNLAAATAITCAHLDAMHLLKPSLPVPMKRRILLTWLTRSVDGSMPLLRKAGLNVGTNRKPPYAVICGVNAKP